MTKRAALAFLLLAGCDKPAPSTATDFTPAENRTRITALENRVEALEKENAILRSDEDKDILMLRDITAAGAKDTREVNAELERLADTDDALRKNIDYLGSLHGIPPQRVK